jgi:glutamyl/glutaminyl-tRNA synthetase
VNNSNSKFDYDKCKWVNAEHLKKLSAADLLKAAAPFLTAAGLPADDDRMPAALQLARERAQLLSEIPDVVKTIFEEGVSYDEESLEKVKSREGVADAVNALRNGLASVEDWSIDGIKSGIQSAADGMGAKMGMLMLPCRVGVMGSTTGADLVPVLELLGKEAVLKRLEGFEALLEA